MNKQAAGKKPGRNIRLGFRGGLRHREPLPSDEWLLAEAWMEYEPRYHTTTQAVDLCAEQRGFHDGAEFKGWLEAEANADQI